WKALRCQARKPARGVSREVDHGLASAADAWNSSTAAPEDDGTASSNPSSVAADESKAALDKKDPMPSGDDWGGDTDDWGGGADDWGMGDGSWGASTEGSGAADELDVLAKQLDAAQANSAPAGTSAAPKLRVAPAGKRPPAPADEEPAAEKQNDRVHTLSSFVVYGFPEPEQWDKGGDQATNRLLSEYEQREGHEVQQAEGAWDKEGYEHDATKHTDKIFHKFSRRLRRCPTQCARYSFGGEPIWPKKNNPVVRPCHRCGAPRTFEMQLMPPLLHYFEEGADWEASQGWAASPEIDLDAWDWLTAVVYTCSKSCWGEVEGAAHADLPFFVEEQILVESE
ncbi:hypothetical protein CYMTET_33490, partial [Cymbomonas tetramitiformis]